MVTKVNSVTLFGLDVLHVIIEVDLQLRSPKFEIIGMPSQAVLESVNRVESAIRNSGFYFPGKRIIINLSPAGIKKIGTLFDLPIAVGILCEEEGINIKEKTLIVGELSLDGQVLPIPGALPIAIKANKLGFNKIICPEKNANEMAIIKEIEIIPVKNLKQTIEYLKGRIKIEPMITYNYEFNIQHQTNNDLDMSDVKGQEAAKRALEICAAGGHNSLMIGPPGTGKTMLAKRFSTILPPLSIEEAIETTMIYSVSGMIDPENPLITKRPFRSPHHTASDIAIIGGGKFPKPGEISLSHNGVLFLDELQLFKSNVLQVLRQPLEENKIVISRAEGSVEFPANFILITALNPSKRNNDINDWDINEMKILLNKISGPLLDRIDIHIQVPKVNYNEIKNNKYSESSKEIRDRVIKARQIQFDRLKKHNILTNSKMSHKLIEKYCICSKAAESLLSNALEKMLLSIRVCDKILKISRTIADLDNSELIHDYHLAEALQYRILDRLWNLFN